MNEEKVISITEDASIVTSLGVHPSSIYADRNEATYQPKPIKAVYITDPEISDKPKKIWPPAGETIVCQWGTIADCLLILHVQRRNGTGDYEDTTELIGGSLKTNGVSTEYLYPNQSNGVVIREQGIINGGSDYTQLINSFTTLDGSSVNFGSNVHIFSIINPTDIDVTITGNTTDLYFHVNIWTECSPILINIVDNTNRGYTHYLLACGEYIQKNGTWYLREMDQNTIIIDSSYKSLRYGYIPSSSMIKTNRSFITRLNLEKVYGIGPSYNNGWLDINNINDYHYDVGYTILGSTDGTNFQIMREDPSELHSYNRFITFSGDSIIMSTECIIEASLSEYSTMGIYTR